MKITNSCKVWTVMLTTNKQQSGNRYLTNHTATVVCQTIQEAISLVEEHFPDSRINSINSSQNVGFLILSREAITEGMQNYQLGVENKE